MQYISFVSAIFGILGLLSGGLFYLKYTATKANIEGQEDTIRIYKENNEAKAQELSEIQGRVERLQAYNEALQASKGNTPEILKLTKAVQTQTDSITKLAQTITTESRESTRLLSELVTEFRKNKP